MPLVVTSVMTKGILDFSDNEDIVNIPNTIHLYADSNIGSRLLNSSIYASFIIPQANRNINF